MQIQTTQLKKSLSQFGLNPTDWKIRFFEESSALIQNNQDKEIVMIGHLKKIKISRSNQSLEKGLFDEQIVFQDLQLLPF